MPKIVAQSRGAIDVIVEDERCGRAIEALRNAIAAATFHDAVPGLMIDSSDKLYRYLTASIAHLPIEQLRALWLDGRYQFIAEDLLASGTIDGVDVHPRELVRRALERNARSVILVHNHPSGDATPSVADAEFTRRLCPTLEMLSCSLIDHLVVSSRSVVSMRELGLL